MEKPIEIKRIIRGQEYSARVHSDPFTKEKYVEFLYEGNIGTGALRNPPILGIVELDSLNIDKQNKFGTVLGLYYAASQGKGVRLCTNLYSEDINTKKGDKVSIQFKDGSILDLYLSDDDGSIILFEEDCKVLSVKKPVYLKYESLAGSAIYKFEPYGSYLINWTKFALYVANQVLGWKPEKKPILTPVFNSPSANYDEVADYCYVYLMLDCNTGLYKIGMSNNPEFREKTLQSEKPTISKIAEKRLPSRDFAAAIEKMMHNLYADKRVRGEWFNLSDYEIWQVKKFFE